MATPTHSPTGWNLAAIRAARLGLGHRSDVSMIEGEVGVLENASAGRAAWPRPRGSAGRGEAEPDVLPEAGQIEPGEADGDREGGPV